MTIKTKGFNLCGRLSCHVYSVCLYMLGSRYSVHYTLCFSFTFPYNFIKLNKCLQSQDILESIYLTAKLYISTWNEDSAPLLPGESTVAALCSLGFWRKYSSILLLQNITMCWTRPKEAHYTNFKASAWIPANLVWVVLVAFLFTCRLTQLLSSISYFNKYSHWR